MGLHSTVEPGYCNEFYHLQNDRMPHETSYRGSCNELWVVPITAFASPSHNVTRATSAMWMKQTPNWGRWGKERQRGHGHLLTPPQVKQGGRS